MAIPWLVHLGVIPRFITTDRKQLNKRIPQIPAKFFLTGAFPRTCEESIQNSQVGKLELKIESGVWINLRVANLN